MTREPFSEPISKTLARTVGLAVVIGGIAALARRDISRWPLAALLALWITFGGHWVEVLFLNGLRPRLPESRWIQAGARILVWFVCGSLLGLAMAFTAVALTGPARFPPLWYAGVGFIGVELLVHLLLQARGLPSFYNGNG